MITKKFLDDGSPIKSVVPIAKANKMVKFANPDKIPSATIATGTLGRIHSRCNDIYSVWLLEESMMTIIIVEVPLYLMGQYFVQHQHNIFPHFA